jgi:hypothetical protein
LIQSPTSASVYQSNLLSALVNTGITNTTVGAKGRAFCDAVGSQMATLDANDYTMIGQSLLPYATGDNLDFIGAIFGVFRLQQQDAQVLMSDSNFEFYVESGTFGSINNGNNIIVPSGTQIYTNQPNGPVFVTTSDVTCLSTSSSIYFAAISQSTGSTGNAASGVFTNVGFSNYALSQFGDLLVTNNFGIVSGTDQETDDDFRYRISLYLQSRSTATQTSLQLAVLEVPGVQNVVFQNQAGTYLAYVYGISPNIGENLLSMVQTALNNNTAYPLTGIAVAPDLVGISFATTVTFAANTSSTAQSAALIAAAQAAQTYTNNIAIDGTFVINQLAAAIISSSTTIQDIGSADQPINNIYIWRSRADGTRYSRTLINDYTLQTGERLVVESSITNPITLTVAAS